MSALPKLHVAVLMGGPANEREVSLMSGNGVADALEDKGHRVTRIDMDRQVASRIAEADPDVVFNALHGVPGEDGTVQRLVCELTVAQSPGRYLYEARRAAGKIYGSNRA